MASFFELAGQALFGVAVLAPLTWPLLIAAAVSVWLGRRRQHKGLIESRTRLVVSAAIQSLPSIGILICGVLDNSTVPGGRSYEHLIPVAFLAQLPIDAAVFWWCRRAGLFSIAIGLAWAAYSSSAAIMLNLSRHPL